ncbi:MAG: hypothetical protein KOO62_00095 [candidate division Zixibacteria bacterium]|nr:hypothetical protein [candidate division Zixibacteria bacterium]
MSRRSMAYIGAGLALIAIWFFMIYAPYCQDKERQLSSNDNALRQLTDFDNIMSGLPSFLSVSEDLEATRLDVVSHLYAKTDIIELFDHLEQIAYKGNLKPLEISPSIRELLYMNTLITTTAQPLFVNIDMRLSGGYTDCGRFIQTLEQTPYFRGINYCRMIKGTSDNRHALSLEVSFRAMLGHLGTTS